jgi:NAD(P)-dependent dehydrogenase (short-subunit alcohol dehydrogenase family)
MVETAAYQSPDLSHCVVLVAGATRGVGRGIVLAYELRRRNVAAVALTPGFLRSEVMLARFGVSEATWQDAVTKDPN